MCHNNMLKQYHSGEAANGEPQQSKTAVVGVSSLVDVQQEWEADLKAPSEGHQSGRLGNSEFLSTVNDQLSYLPASQKQDVIDLLRTYPAVLGDVPTRTTVLMHDIDVGKARPIKQHAYRCPPAKGEIMNKEVNYLVANGLAKPSCSPWSSP